MQLNHSPHNEITVLLLIVILLVPAMLIFRRKNRWKLLLALFIVVPLFVAYMPAKQQQTVVQLESNFTLEQQQTAFQKWFKQYQLSLDNLDKTLLAFQQLVQQLEAEELSKAAAAEEAAAIRRNAKAYHQELAQLMPPPELALTEQELISAILRDTQSVSSAHLLIIEQTATLLQDEQSSAKLPVLANELKKLLVLNNPAYLDIMPKLIALKTGLKL